MRFSRLTWAIVAGSLGLAGAFAVQSIAPVLGLVVGRRLFAAVSVAIIGGVLWAADHFDLMRSAYAQPTLGLHDDPPTLPSARGDAGDDSNPSR